MIRVVHLLDDFAWGGVTAGLAVFNEPALAALGTHETLPINRHIRIAPRLDADAIVTHMPPCWARLPYLLSLRLLNPDARLIHVEHSYTGCWEAHNVRSRARFRTMLAAAMRIYDDVVCVSDAQADWLAQASGLPRGRIRAVHPWAGRDSLLDLAPASPRDGAPLRLGALGRFNEAKNFVALARAMRDLSPSKVELHIAGDGQLDAEIRAAASDAPHVHFHGKIDDIEGFLAQCDAVIVPSIFESFGQVALEARLAGRPILVAPTDGLPEQVGRGGMIADCSDAAAIANAIRQFAAQPLAHLGALARQDARTHRDRVVSGWLDLLGPIAVRRLPPIAA